MWQAGIILLIIIVGVTTWRLSRLAWTPPTPSGVTEQDLDGIIESLEALRVNVRSIH